MRGRRAIGFGFLVVLALVVASGCTTDLRRLQGANQELIAQRNALNRQIADLEAQVARERQGKSELEGQVRRLQTDVDYWREQAEAYSEAIDQYRQVAVPGIGEQFMRGLADEMGGIYLEGGGIRLESDVLFDSGRSTLKSEAIAALQRAGAAFRQREAENLYLRIDGHTDSQPIRFSPWDDNMHLSQARARAVWLQLVEHGIAPERMFTAGFGEHLPIDDNATPEGRARNRRVEIWLVPEPGVVDFGQ